MARHFSLGGLRINTLATACGTPCASYGGRLDSDPYKPKPIDTSMVSLSNDIGNLVEELAKNSHDVWARSRIAEGWRYGPQRDDARKEHPSLVPYDRLPESEKEYDRNSAMETLKATVSLGYRIQPKEKCTGELKPVHSAAAQAQSKHRIDDMDDSNECPSSHPLKAALGECRTAILPAFRRADAQALKYQKWYQMLVYAAAIGGTSAVLLAALQLSDLLQSALVWKAEAVAAFLTLIIVLTGMATKFQDLWLLERYKAERLRMLKFCFLLEPGLWNPGTITTSRLNEKLSDTVKEITASTFASLEGWVSRSWLPRVHDSTAGLQFKNEGLEALVRYYHQKRLDVQMEYFAEATKRNFFRDLRLRLAGSALFFGSVAFVLAHLAVQWSRGDPGWSKSLMLVAAVLPVIGAGFRVLRTAHEYARNASRFEATHDALSALSGKLRDATSARAIFQELGFCEQVLESDLREWMRLMVEAEWFG